MISIEVNPLLESLLPEDLLNRAAYRVLIHQNAPEGAGLTILITDDDQLHQLNRDYLEIDAPTDVLSFPAGEIDPESGTVYLGDVVVSLPRAEAQALSAGHSLEAELQLLVIHGVLHLLGHDHARDEEKSRMWADQEEILAQLGLSGIKIND